MRRLKWVLVLTVLALIFSGQMSRGDLTFYLVDNFEAAEASKWFSFGGIKVAVAANPIKNSKDLIAESCGSYVLNISGSTNDWYVGGMGTDLSIDASQYSRLQLDVYGSLNYGKLKIELFDDDNNSSQIEQDKNWQPIYDDKLAVEIPILGPGFTRISIPFSAFVDENPGVGDDKWNPTTKSGSAGLVRVQMGFISKEKVGKVNVSLDNILLTY